MLENACYELVLYICCVSEGRVSFASFDIVCNKLSNRVRHVVGLYEFVKKFMSNAMLSNNDLHVGW